MENSQTYSKSFNIPSFTSINTISDQPSMTSYGDGYVYTGPLTPQQYGILAKASNEAMKQPNQDGPSMNPSSSASITNLSLSSSPSTEIVNSNSVNQYQFKVMLLGDSGVGKCREMFEIVRIMLLCR